MIAALWAVAVSYGQDIDFIDIPAPFVPTCPDAVYPGEVWDNVGPSVRVEQATLVKALDDALFPPTLNFAAKGREGIRTNAVVVVHRGRIVYERYRAPWTPDGAHLGWSMSKSVTSVLTGIAVKQGLVSTSDSICDHLGDLPEASCQVTVQDLLDMASGFQWRETYEGGSPTESAVLAMLYGEGASDMARFVATQPLARPPGSAWQYSSGDTNVLSAAIGRPLTAKFGERFPWTEFFDVIGMKTAVFERDAAGTYVGSSYVYASPRDWARFGFFLLHDGCWASEQLLPDRWMAEATTIAEPARTKVLPRADSDVQARLFWVNQTLPEHGVNERWCPSVSESMYAARGHWGQSVTVVPDRDLVVVRLADDRDDTYQHDVTMQRVLALVEAL